MPPTNRRTALVFTVAAAAASWYLVEEPVRRWRGRLEKRSRKLEPARLVWVEPRVPATHSSYLRDAA